MKVRMAVPLIISSLFHSFCCTFAGSTDIHDILGILASSPQKFHELGIGLNLDASKMEVILHEYKTSHSTLYDSLTQVLTAWLKLNYPYKTLGCPSLSLLVKAVDIYDRRLAVKVFKRFTAKAGEPTC